MNNRILVIDDEQGIRDLFCFLLEPYGFQVFTAEDGIKGIEMVKKDNYDIIFLDIHMPKMQGSEVLKEIKKINVEDGDIILVPTEIGWERELAHISDVLMDKFKDKRFFVIGGSKEMIKGIKVVHLIQEEDK